MWFPSKDTPTCISKNKNDEIFICIFDSDPKQNGISKSYYVLKMAIKWLPNIYQEWL